MTDSWEKLRLETAARWDSLHQSPQRLDAVLTLIRTYRAESKSLTPLLNGILVLLESSQAIQQLDALALCVLVELDHWLENIEHRPRWVAVIQHYLNATDETETRMILYKSLTQIIQQIGHGAEALTMAEETLALSNASVSPHVIGQLVVQVVWIALMMNERPRAQTALKFARHSLSTRDDSDQTTLLGYVLFAEADDARRNDSLIEAVHLARASLRIFEDLAEMPRAMLAVIYRMVGIYEWAYGNYRRALKRLKQAERLYVLVGDEFGRSWAISNQAIVYRYLGQMDKAEYSTKRGIAMSRKYEAQWQITYETGNLAAVYLVAGFPDKARRQVCSHWAMARRLNIASEVMRAKGNLGLINLDRGSYRAAIRILWADYGYSKASHRLESLACVCGGLAQAYARSGHLWRAQTLAYACVRLGRQIQSRRIRVMALQVLAECLPSDRAYAVYQRCLALSEPDSYEALICRVALLRWVSEDERQAQWQILSDILIERGLGAWLFDCDADHLPKFTICI